METFDAIRTVLAVRSFLDRPIPRDAVERIIDSARLTGSSMNRQPWHFIVVEQADTLTQLGALARTGPYIAQAPLAVVVLVERTVFAVSDASRAIQSMMITAWADGIGSNWVGFHGLDEVRHLLAIPEHLDIFAIVPFGYPADLKSGTKKERKPAEAVVSYERYGRSSREG